MTKDEEIPFENNEIVSDSFVVTENEVVSSQNENSAEDLKEVSFSDEPSVRRLSLFDNISANISDDIKEEAIKSEPTISENIDKIEEHESLETTETTVESDSEFSVRNDEINEEYNQETEEELLDIPTFLRRQAN